jgi:hypothetical protein
VCRTIDRQLREVLKQLGDAAHMVAVMMRAENGDRGDPEARQRCEYRCRVARIDQRRVRAGVAADHPDVVVLERADV